MPATMYERSATLLEAGLGDELVALDTEAGRCYGFNAVAARVWQLLERPQSPEMLHEVLAGEFDVEPETCHAEVGELLHDLVAKGLIRRVG